MFIYRKALQSEGVKSDEGITYCVSMPSFPLSGKAFSVVLTSFKAGLVSSTSSKFANQCGCYSNWCVLIIYTTSVYV